MILFGNTLASHLNEELKAKIGAANAKPCLAVILVGDNLASKTYVEVKRRACESVGINSLVISLPSTVSLEELKNKILELNENKDVHGILVQLPLPAPLQADEILIMIDPKKDVDGLHPENMGKLLLGIKGGLIPCTPLGIQTLLEKNGITATGKHMVIVGRSNIVGKPLAALFMQKKPLNNATVTVAHSQSQNLIELTKSADILVAALGKPHFFTKEMIKEGAIVIDVGIHRDPNSNHLIGDVDFESVKEKCAAITPVPKGVGPMTVAMLLQNTFQCYKLTTHA